MNIAYSVGLGVLGLVLGTGAVACSDANATGSPSASAASHATVAHVASAPKPLLTLTAPTPSATTTDTPCAKAVHALHSLKHPKDAEDPGKISYETKNCESEKWSQKGIDCILAAKDAATAEKCDLKK